jgi:sulfite exporter TauE/SafE
MSADLAALCAATASIALAHTLMGPDHYLPFVAMARAGGWSRARVSWVTALCGLGHVASSVVLGGLGVALGLSLTSLSGVDSVRGEIAAWGLILFGAVYAAWGLRAALQGATHSHWHLHPGAGPHHHEHAHHGGHLHLHEARHEAGHAASQQANHQESLGIGALLTVFILGPCEPLIPLLMYPAATGSAGRMLLVIVVFTAVTIATMLTAVLLALAGLRSFTALPLRRYGHAITGGIVCACGMLIQFGGL